MSRCQLNLSAKRRKQKLDYDAKSILLKIASDKVIEKQLFDCLTLSLYLKWSFPKYRQKIKRDALYATPDVAYMPLTCML
jgi:hypothetical protein